MKKYITNNEEETKKVAYQFASSLKNPTIILLMGDLGAGKTVFTKGFVSFFDNKQNVTSPTFTLQNCYGNDIYHFDLYRLNNYQDFANIGAEEYIYNGNYCLIEWPERIGLDNFPKNSVLVSIKKVDDNQREILIGEKDER